MADVRGRKTTELAVFFTFREQLPVGWLFTLSFPFIRASISPRARVTVDRLSLGSVETPCPSPGFINERRDVLYFFVHFTLSCVEPRGKSLSTSHLTIQVYDAREPFRASPPAPGRLKFSSRTVYLRTCCSRGCLSAGPSNSSRSGRQPMRTERLGEPSDGYSRDRRGGPKDQKTHK